MIFQPICTCAVPGILGCTVHTYGPPTDVDGLEPVVTIARKIVGGEAFTDEDAQRLAVAFLQAQP